MIISVVQCDQCGRKKDQANHWFQIRVDDEDDEPCMVICPCGERCGAELDFKHFCGEACVLKYVSDRLARIAGGIANG